MLAILKAEAVYVPIDPSWPQDRIQYVSNDSALKVIIDSAFLKDYYLTSNDNVLEGYNTLKSSDLAYVIYTSGSTGLPKGVKVSHSNLVNLCLWHQSEYEILPSSRGTIYSGIAFDASIWEIFPYLTSGASLCPVDDEALRLDVDLLARYLQNNSISHSYLPTVVCHELVNKEISLPNTKILTGGDALYLQKQAKFSLFNNYGPTETTVVATSFRLDSNNSTGAISIGRPIANSSTYILDAYGNLLPKGVVGELYIGGKGVSKGYLNRVELTNEKFIPNPFIPGELMYRTGDLASWTKDGTIDFKGRADKQIQLRGYRIELGEIVTQVECHPEVDQAVILIEGKGDGKYLVCYYISPNLTN